MNKSCQKALLIGNQKSIFINFDLIDNISLESIGSGIYIRLGSGDNELIHETLTDCEAVSILEEVLHEISCLLRDLEYLEIDMRKIIIDDGE